MELGCEFLLLSGFVAAQGPGGSRGQPVPQTDGLWLCVFCAAHLRDPDVSLSFPPTFIREENGRKSACPFHSTFCHRYV